MWKMTCRLMAVVLLTAAVTTRASEQPATDEDRWLPSSVQSPRPFRSATTRDWVAQVWHPDTDSLSNQRWPAENEEREAMAWVPQEPLGAAGLHFNSRGNLDDDNDDLGNAEAIVDLVQQQQVSPWLAKRQPPRRLGSLVDLYKDVAHGLSPFVANPEIQLIPAKPVRRSARRPAACRFGPFGLVCWNAARRGAVMRQRSAQYSQ